MGLQHRMPLLPSDAEMVNEHLAVARCDGRVTFFNASGPIFTCQERDEGALRFAAAYLTEPSLSLATPSQIAKVLGRHRSRVHEYRKRYREAGAEALGVQRRGPRGASKLKGILLARAQKHLNEGSSNRKVAKLVGVEEGTIRKAIKEHRLVRPQPIEKSSTKRSTGEIPSTPRERSDEDAACVGGVATKRQEERVLAPTGLLVEATPRFEAAESVAKAGVLVALPALLGQGLVDVGEQVYGSLKNGYYGLTSMLLTFGLTALMRIKSSEGLTSHAPGEFGLVLGLDRAPEMKTARRKLASRGRALELSRAFSERWAAENPEALGYLYIDGYVRPYHGRKYRLPKTHVQRRRLCMPATTEYWVNDANVEPLMFVTAPANEGLLAMMDKELLPEIRRLAGDDRRVTLIFDREGWSPKRFKKWKETSRHRLQNDRLGELPLHEHLVLAGVARQQRQRRGAAGAHSPGRGELRGGARGELHGADRRAPGDGAALHSGTLRRVERRYSLAEAQDFSMAPRSQTIQSRLGCDPSERCGPCGLLI